MGRGTRDALILLAVLVVGAVVVGLRGEGTGTTGPPAAQPTPTTGQPLDVDQALTAMALTVPNDARTWTGTVVHVSDGDTLIARVEDPRATTLVAGEEVRVRLLRVDTPEREREDQVQECWAQQAWDALRALAPEGSLATFQYDLEPQDQYGRELAHVWNDRGVWVNGSLLAGGHAEVATFRPNVDHDDRVRQLQAAAFDAGRGRWGNC